MTAAERAALQQALAAEHAAAYGYGAAGPHVPAARHAAAEAGFDAHRAARDRLEARLASAGATPTPAAPAYLLRPAPDTAPAAFALLIDLEDAVTAAYAGVLAATAAADLRRLAVVTLQAAVRRAVAWRLAAGRMPASAPLPGLAGP